MLLYMYRRWTFEGATRLDGSDDLRLFWDDDDEDGTGRLAGVEAVLDEVWPRGLVRRRAGSLGVSCKGRVDGAE